METLRQHEGSQLSWLHFGDQRLLWIAFHMLASPKGDFIYRLLIWIILFKTAGLIELRDIHFHFHLPDKKKSIFPEKRTNVDVEPREFTSD